MSEALALITQDTGATTLELVLEDDAILKDRAEAQWLEPLIRRGVLVGALLGTGHRSRRLPRYARIVALGVPDRVAPLAAIALEASNDAFWTFDLATSTFTSSDRLRKLLGLDGVAVLTFTDLLESSDRERFQRNIAVAQSRGEDSFEALVTARNRVTGMPLSLQVRVRLLRDVEGMLSRISASVTDVTDFEESRRSLERQRQQLLSRASLAVELAELVTRLIHAADEREVEALGAVALSSLLGADQSGFVRWVEDRWELHLPIANQVRVIDNPGALSVVLDRNESVLDLDVGGNDPLSKAIKEFGYNSCTGFALDAGANVLGVVLVLHKARRHPDTDERMTGMQLSVMLAVALARLADQQRVQRSEQQLEHALALTRSGSWTWDVRRGRMTWSRELSRLNGLSAAETNLGADEALAYVHRADRPLQQAHLERLIATGETQTWMTRHLLPDGRVEHRRNVASAERNAENRVVRVHGVSSDMTIEVEAKAELETALSRTTRYQTLFSLSDTLSAMIDLKGHFADVSPTWHSALGWSHEELGRRRVLSFLHKDDRRSTARLARRAVLEGHSFSMVNRFRTRDGRYRYLSWNAVPDPKTQVLYAVAHDVTNLTETKQRLERSEELFRRAGALAHVGGWEYTVGTGTLVWNEEIRRIHEVDQGFVPSLDVWLFFYDANSRPVMARALERCVQYGEPFDLEAGLITARGNQVWVRAQGTAERLGGRTTRVFGAFQDITQHRESREAVLAASRAKSQFLANTSHEIRTPLNGILGMTQLALDTRLSHEQREYLDAVRTSGQNLLSIVNDILDISKIESGKLELESVPTSLERVLFDAVRNQAARAHDKGLELVAFVDPVLETPVLSDPVRLGQIITNLVGNAVKFTEQGDIVVRAVPDDTQPDGVRISVRDSGVGIAQDRIGAIFDAFTQADGSTNRRFGGTGLGLTITRELVQRMGGHVTVDSEPGAGSTFTVRLPLLKTHPVSARPSTPRRRRILVVDDHAMAREALCAMLEAMGELPVAAPSAAESMRLLLEAYDGGRPFELLIARDALGATSGLELCEAIDNHDGLNRIERFLLVNTIERPDPTVLDRFHVTRTLTRPVAPWELREALDGLGTVAQPRVEPRPVVPLARRQTLRILLAEDNAINARLALRLLEKLGHQVVHVTDGQLAIDALARSSFDAVLMDMQMPTLDGLEATRRIRATERERRVPIIALTANAMKGDDELCFAAGMDGYLTKPIDLPRLRDELLRVGAADRPATGTDG